MIKKLFAALMAMAMVVSVAPAKAALTGPTTACPAGDKATAAVVNDYVEELAAEIELETVKLTDEFDFDGGEDVTIADVLALVADWNADGTKDADETLEAALEVADACLSDEAAYLKYLTAAVATYAPLAGFYEDMLEEDTGYLTVGYEADITNETDALETLEELQGLLVTLTSKKVSPYLAYVGNVEDAEEMIEEIVAGIEEVIEVIAETYDVELASAYYTSFVELLVDEELYEVTTTTNIGGTTTIEEGIVGIADYEWVKAGKRSGTTYELEQLIADIEDDKAGLDGSYEDYEEEVEHFMEGLEDLLAASEALDELVADVKALEANSKIGKAAVAEAESITGETYTKNTTWDEVFADAAVADLFTELNPAEFEMLAELVDLVEEEFYTVTYTKKGSRWLTKVEDTENYPHLEAVFEAAGVELPDLAGLFANWYDEEEEDYTGETVYEVLTAYMADVVDTYEAIVEDIKGITVNNLNSKNVDAVVAAYDALDKVEDYAGNYTRAELKAIEKAAENVSVLYLKALFNGVTTEKVTGWVDLGNGNWDYYGEDGNIVTGWVAAGTNWYYVSNGHMLRNTWIAKDATGAVWYYVGNDGAMVSNTVVDGYAINANGEWVK